MRVKTYSGSLNRYYSRPMQKTYIMKNGEGVRTKFLATKALIISKFCNVIFIVGTPGYHPVDNYLKLVEY